MQLRFSVHSSHMDIHTECSSFECVAQQNFDRTTTPLFISVRFHRRFLRHAENKQEQHRGTDAVTAGIPVSGQTECNLVGS